MEKYILQLLMMILPKLSSDMKKQLGGFIKRYIKILEDEAKKTS